MILLIDNYDSFTYNLFQQIGNFQPDIRVIRNDVMTLEEIEQLQPEAIIISPGPGRPEQAGKCMEIIQRYYNTIPILGICLGHQAIAAAFGGRVKAAKTIMHGKMSTIVHKSNGVFVDLPINLEVMRYHSLAVEKETLPDCLEIQAQTEDGEIMAIYHKDFPVIGIQFHPESIGTREGDKMIRNFLRISRKGVLK